MGGNIALSRHFVKLFTFQISVTDKSLARYRME